MKTVDADIKELMRTMRSALDFVRNPTSVKYVLFRSERTIEELLRVIFESSQRIREYIDSTKIGNKPRFILLRSFLICLEGRVWITDTTMRVLRGYKRQVESLSVELHGHTIANIADKLEGTGSKSTESRHDTHRYVWCLLTLIS